MKLTYNLVMVYNIQQLKAVSFFIKSKKKLWKLLFSNGNNLYAEYFSFASVYVVRAIPLKGINF